MDPYNFKNGTHYHDAVKAVEGRGEISGEAQSVHSDTHFEHKHAKKTKLCVNCKKESFPNYGLLKFLHRNSVNQIGWL